MLVSICCITYNHAPYIRECIEGFLMQKTDFAFEVLIHDDCSTDGTTEIIKEYEAKYPDIIKPLYEEENQWRKGRKGNSVFNYPRAKGKYIALCEGDDYWTDPLKLQKQVDFMEQNPSFSLCFTNIKILNEDICTIDENPMLNYQNVSLPREKKDLFYHILLGKCRIQTMSVLYRCKYLSLRKQNNRDFMMGDTPLWLDLSQFGSFHYIQDQTGCYRVHTGSASRDPKTYNKFRLSMFEMRIYYCNKYGYSIPTKIKREYNKSAAIVMCDSPKNSVNLPYPLYDMNLIQNIFLYLIKKSSFILKIIKHIWKFENKIQHVLLRKF